MSSKILLIGGGIIVLYLIKKKMDKAKEDKIFEEALKKNEIPCEEKIDEIRLNLDSWIKARWPEISDENLLDTVINLTTVDFIEEEENL